MPLPRLLMVDDSPSVRAHVLALLEGLYDIETAENGALGLAAMRRRRPDAVLLDLSMPVMGGADVLLARQDDPQLAGVPVVVLSSESERADWCLRHGATAFLAKPPEAESLRRTLAGALRGARTTAVLPVTCGDLSLLLPLDAVRRALPRLELSALPGAPGYLAGLFVLEGEPIVVVDLARRLGRKLENPLVEQALVVVRTGRQSVGLCVDVVGEPQEVTSEQVVDASEVAGFGDGQLARLVGAFVRMPEGPLPLLAPHALLSRGLMSRFAPVPP